MNPNAYRVPEGKWRLPNFAGAYAAVQLGKRVGVWSIENSAHGATRPVNQFDFETCLKIALAVRGSSVTGKFHMAVEHQAVATLRMRGAAFELGRGGADGIREINIHGQFHFGCAAG